MKQQRMFETEDLPLFSGTAPTGHIETFDPLPAHRQESLAKCRFCADTGRVKDGFCWCKVGKALRVEREGETYYITNESNRPINTMFDGSGPIIKVLKSCCDSYRTQEEAEESLAYLRQDTGRPLSHLKVSTYAKF